jgi:hypothetical protein
MSRRIKKHGLLVQFYHNLNNAQGKRKVHKPTRFDYLLFTISRLIP